MPPTGLVGLPERLPSQAAGLVGPIGDHGRDGLRPGVRFRAVAGIEGWAGALQPPCRPAAGADGGEREPYVGS